MNTFVTAERLRLLRACNGAVAVFEERFPDGCTLDDLRSELTREKYLTWLEWVDTAFGVGNAFGGHLRRVEVGDGKTAIAGHYGIAVSGTGGTSKAGIGGRVRSGGGGTLILEFIDHNDALKRSRLAVAYVGEDGIEANVLYRLNDQPHKGPKFERSHLQI